MSVSPKSARYLARFNELLWYRSNVPCMEACPVRTDSGRYVQLIAEGRDEEAFLVARSPNPLASVCGRICAAPCEDACRRGLIDEPVTIRPLKRFVTERFGAESAKPETSAVLLGGETSAGCERTWHMRAQSTIGRDRKVAVIGSGPAGVGCAHDLALAGYQVTIFEAMADPGGMLRYGIPDYRLPRVVLEREIQFLQRFGVELRAGEALDEDYGLAALREDGFEAIFLSVGAQRGRELELPGAELDGVVKAIDYLLNLNQGYRVDLGRRVAVVGGGSVALDAARTAVREFYRPMTEIEKTAEAVGDQTVMDAARNALRGGASEVHVVSLEALEQMPAAQTVQGQEELEDAIEEGIKLHPAWGPREIRGSGKVESVEFQAVNRVFDDAGRFAPQYDESRRMTLEVDSVVLAIGQRVDHSFLREADGVELTPAGTIKIHPETLATTAPDVFAGGDAAFGPRIAIEAVANGKTAARSIRNYLESTAPPSRHSVHIEKIPIDEYELPERYERHQRQAPGKVSTERRTGITEVEEVFTDEQARRQAERCLACHVDTIYDPELCVLCGRCADICPEHCLVFVPSDQVDLPERQRDEAMSTYGHDPVAPMTTLLKDDAACIRCGLCAERCPTEAMTMERLNFVEGE